METVSTEGSKWWQDVECHFSSRWGLPKLDQYMLDTIKDTNRFELDLTILPDFMTIERLLFSAWIKLSHIIFTEEASSSEAVQLVHKANEYLNNNSDKLGDGSLIGYRTIIYAFFMWIYHKSESAKEFKEAEEKLKGLFQSDPGKRRPNYQVFVDVTHAWTLGRLGPEKICKALRLLDNALGVMERKRGSEQWLFAKALIQGRVAREGICFDNFQNNAPSNLSKLLAKEKQTIEQVVGKNKPRFDLATAHLGTVMAALDNTGKNYIKALGLITESVAKDCDDSELVLILAKLYRDINKTEMLKDILQYCETERIVQSENRSSNVYFQLGLLYYKQSKLTDNTSMVDKALKMVQKAVDRDKNHTQARLWKAMIFVSPHINNSKGAREIHSQILKEKYNSATQAHILRSISSESFSSVYERLQYLQNVFHFLFFCVKHHAVTDYLGNVRFESVVRNDANRRMKILQQEDKPDSSDEKTKSAAIKYLGEVNLHLGRYKTAEKFFKRLRNELFFQNNPDIKVERGLAECLYRQGKFQELRELRVVSREGDVREASRIGVKEIQGLKYLAEGKEKQEEMMSKCEEAIELGSLDACLLMLNMHQHFQEKFLVFRERFAHRLAKIKSCTIRDTSDSQQTSNQVQEQTNKDKMKHMITDKIDGILKYSRMRQDFHESHKSVHEKLKEIRSLLLDFEYCLLQKGKSCSTTKGFWECLNRQCIHKKEQFAPGTTSAWNDDCRKAAEVVLNKARFLLDEVMSCLQIAVLGKKHSRSEFPIIVDWKEGLQNTETATVQLQTRLSQLFTGGYELYIPEVVFDSLLKIQPMFDEENEWLALLSHTVNQMKHSGLMLGPVCIRSDETLQIQLCTAYVVRRSCEEVDKIATFVLNKCTQMM